jgi:hypothetical protein
MRSVLADEAHQLVHTLGGLGLRSLPGPDVHEVVAVCVAGRALTEQEVVQRSEVEQERVDEGDPAVVVVVSSSYSSIAYSISAR